MRQGLIILGHCRSGKDSAAEILKDEFGLDFLSSSEYALFAFIFDALKDKYGYESKLDCFSDRQSPEMRAVWYDLICQYNMGDPSRMAREIFEQVPVYVGMRSRVEFLATRSLQDWDITSIWIDASERIPPEPQSSMTILREDADSVIDNNGTLKEFRSNIKEFGRKYVKYLENARPHTIFQT